jgi:hypothetical protein
MNVRRLDFITGIEASVQPDAGTPTDPNDLITLSYFSSHLVTQRVTGSWGTPYSAVAGTSLAHGLLAIEDSCVMFLKSNGGAVDMSVNPQIAAGTKNGQKLQLIFTSATDTVLLEDGNGLKLLNGKRRSTLGTALEFTWDADSSLWIETFWNNVGDIA